MRLPCPRRDEVACSTLPALASNFQIANRKSKIPNVPVCPAEHKPRTLSAALRGLGGFGKGLATAFGKPKNAVNPQCLPPFRWLDSPNRKSRIPGPCVFLDRAIIPNKILLSIIPNLVPFHAKAARRRVYKKSQLISNKILLRIIPPSIPQSTFSSPSMD